MKKILLKDLASELQISISQVSRALNRKPDVAPEIREKVLELAKKMNYRNFSVRHTKTIGVLVGWLEEFTVPCLNELIREVRKRKMRLITIQHDSISVLNDQLIDGAIAIGLKISSEWSREHNTPLVVINHFGWVLDRISSVFPDADSESRQVMEHLIRLGHKKIARLRGKASSARELNRGLDEFYRIAEEHGIRDSVRNLCSDSKEEQLEQIQDLLKEGFTAFIVIAMERAAQIIQTINDCGKRIPEDVSLITYELENVSPYQTPPLTTLEFNYPVLAKKALDQLLLEIDGQKGESQIIVPTQLNIRKSTGPCPK